MFTLQDFGIDEDSGIDPNMRVVVPNELRTHIARKVKVPNFDKRVWMAAAKINRLQPDFDDLNDATTADILIPLLLFNDRMHDPDAGEHYIARHTNVTIGEKWAATKEGGHPVIPVPHVLIDYMPFIRAHGHTKAKFTLDEEFEFSRFKVDRGTIAPFLSAQMNTTAGPSMAKASENSARDAAAIINAYCALLDEAGLDRSVVDTHHWSVTANSCAAVLWVHWCEDIGHKRYHYTKEILRAYLGLSDPNLERLLGMLRNILKHALGKRVVKLKQAARALYQAEDALTDS